MYRPAPDEQTAVLDGLAERTGEQWTPPRGHWELDVLRQFPHCDPRILHAPSECKYCDCHEEWQALRASWGICFTNYAPDAGELPDPYGTARGKATWMGNIARPRVPLKGPITDRLYRLLAKLRDCTVFKMFQRQATCL